MSGDLLGLRGTTEPSPADGFSSKPTPEEQAALDLVYDGPKPLPPDPGSFYSTAGYFNNVFDENFRELSDAGVLTLEQQAAERTDYPTLIRETRLDPLGIGRELHYLWTAARLAEARGEGDRREIAAQSRADAEASRQVLREQWGDQVAADLLQRVQKFVKQHPKLNEIVNTRGIGSNVKVVTALAEHVREINFR